jgi:hypothetical protein
VPCELAVADQFGDLVSLDHSNWEKHKLIHPEVVPYHHMLGVVLSDPDLVVEFAATPTRERTRHFYRRGVFSGRMAPDYMRIVVGYFQDGAKIKTAHAIAYPRPMGQLVCMRMAQTP